jgi:predicted transcriptional regulator
MNAASLDAVFSALANESRRRILDIVKQSPGCSVLHVAGFFTVSRISVMKHLRILEAAGLLLSEKHGRTRKLYFNAVPIQLIYDRWTTEYSALWASQLTRLKYRVENQEHADG